MFGLDERIASFSTGTTVGIVIVVALVLGLRHASDPDHLASVTSHSLAIVCLAVFAFCTALSMSLLSSGFGLTLSRPRVRRSFARVAPALGFVTLAFGVWYALGSQSLVPYVF